MRFLQNKREQTQSSCLILHSHEPVGLDGAGEEQPRSGWVQAPGEDSRGPLTHYLQPHIRASDSHGERMTQAPLTNVHTVAQTRLFFLRHTPSTVACARLTCAQTKLSVSYSRLWKQICLNVFIVSRGEGDEGDKMWGSMDLGGGGVTSVESPWREVGADVAVGLDTMTRPRVADGDENLFIP